jgi:hypothetical protein
MKQSMRSRATVFATCIFGLVGGLSSQTFPHNLECKNIRFSFQYPDNWELTHNGDDSAVIQLRGQDDVRIAVIYKGAPYSGPKNSDQAIS